MSMFDCIARVQALPAPASAADAAAASASSASAADGASISARGLGIPFSTRDEAAVSELGA